MPSDEIARLRRDIRRLESKFERPVRPHNTQARALQRVRMKASGASVGPNSEGEPFILTDPNSDTHYFAVRINGVVKKIALE